MKAFISRSVRVYIVAGASFIAAGLAGCGKEEPKPAAKTAPAPVAQPAPPAAQPAPPAAEPTAPVTAPAPVAAAPAPVSAPVAPAIQSEETNTPGVVIEITEMRRSEGVLTVRIRLINSSPTDAGFGLGRGGVYVTAGSKKFFILKDTEGSELYGSEYQTVPKGGALGWWAKFPAPGPEVKKVNFYTPYTPPFEDVPITD